MIKYHVSLCVDGQIHGIYTSASNIEEAERQAIARFVQIAEARQLRFEDCFAAAVENDDTGDLR